MANIFQQNIVLFVILFFAAVLFFLSKFFNRQVTRYYEKVAGYMQAVNTTPPGVFSYGKVIGFYKGKRFEWRLFPVFREESSNFRLEVKMPLDVPVQGKDKTIHITENVSIKENCVFYYVDCRFAFNTQDIPKIFEEVYAAPEKRAKELVVECLECGQQIGANEEKCPKCGWTWKQSQ